MTGILALASVLTDVGINPTFNVYVRQTFLQAEKGYISVTWSTARANGRII